jgi:hypothetical protein
LYQRVCEAATRSGLISIAAVVPIDNPPGMLRAAAGSGVDASSDHGISVTPRAPRAAAWPNAFQQRQPSVGQDLLADPRTAPWRASQAVGVVRAPPCRWCAAACPCRAAVLPLRGVRHRTVACSSAWPKHRVTLVTRPQAERRA